MRENEIETKSIVFNSNNIRIEDNRLISILFSLIFYWKVEDKEDKVWYSHRSHMLTWYKRIM